MGKLNQGGTNVRGGSPKPRAPHTLPKSASARRQATPPTGKGSSVQSAKPTSGSEPPAPTTAPNPAAQPNGPVPSMGRVAIPGQGPSAVWS